VTYEQTLEKAILEHAAYVALHPKTKPNGITKIPGFQDAHVRGMTMQLSTRGLLAASPVDDSGAMRVDEITDAGTTRLGELEAIEAERDQARRAAAAVREAAGKKSFVKRLFGR